jgi:hypothetical protein
VLPVSILAANKSVLSRASAKLLDVQGSKELQCERSKALKSKQQTQMLQIIIRFIYSNLAIQIPSPCVPTSTVTAQYDSTHL